MKYRDFDRKRRYGIRKFAVGTASVLIGTVVFGVSPVLAQEQGNVVAPSTENVEKGKDQSSEEVPKEAVVANASDADKNVVGTELDQDKLKKQVEEKTENAT